MREDRHSREANSIARSQRTSPESSVRDRSAKRSAQSLQHTADEILQLLEHRGIPYCILHGYHESRPDLASDLDIAMHRGKVKELFHLLCAQDTARCIQIIEYGTTGYCFVLENRDGLAVRFLPLDFTTEYRRKGHVFFSSDELLADRRRAGRSWISSPSVEFLYTLVKKTLKGNCPERQRKRLQALSLELGEDAATKVQRLFGKKLADRIPSWLSDDGSSAFQENLPLLRRALLRKTFPLSPLALLRYWLPEIGRLWRRIRRPTGMFVAVFGPDGAGKSTLIRHLSERVRKAFRNNDRFHLRPGIMPSRLAAIPADDPHGRPPQPWIRSTLKIAYLLLDYSLGYLWRIRPRLSRSSLVLFDRYYDDLMVDSRRYRYGGPPWLVRLARRLVPTPDMYMFLDVSEDELEARKREMSREELRRLRGAYRKLALQLPNAILLDGSLPAATVARHASEMVLHYLRDRCRRSFRRRGGGDRRAMTSLLLQMLGDPAGGDSTDQRPGRGYALLPLDDGRGLLLPLERGRTASSALGLYSAQRPRARAVKALLGAGMRCGVAQPFLRRIGPDEGSVVFPLLEHLAQILGRSDLSFAMSLGTPGPDQKPVIQGTAPDGSVLAYVKVGWNRATKDLVQREAEFLTRMKSIDIHSCVIPEPYHAGSWKNRFLLVQLAPQKKALPAPREMTQKHVSICQELAGIHTRRQPLTEAAFWLRLVQRVRRIPNACLRHLVSRGMRRLEAQLGGLRLAFHLCHGDFAPWNMLSLNGTLVLFDWEYADWEGPPGYDLFHFNFQTRTLLQRQPPARIRKELGKNGTCASWIGRYLQALGMGTELLEPLLLLYLLDRLTFRALDERESFSTLLRLSTMVHLCLEEEEKP